MNTLKITLFTFLLALTFSVSAKSNAVAKVIKLKGSVYNLNTNKKLAKGDWISEGTKIATKSRSFAKLLFIDKSKLSIGPKSSIIVESFPKKKAGIITLLKGQIRSKVTKNYMEMSDKDRSKLFIKTKTAAMGVRGTDFQVNYSDENENTSLITFEGAVALGALPSGGDRLDSKYLENIVSDATAVMVRRGQFSGVMPKANSKPISPVKLNFNQLKALEKNDLETKITEHKSSGKAPSRGVVPPGVKGSEFAGTTKKNLAKEISKIEAPSGSLLNTEKKDTAAQNKIKSSGFKVRGGGFLVLDKVVYVQPPKDAMVDPISGEPIIPRTTGYVCNGGNYCNDIYKLGDNGKWEKKRDDAPSRMPASNEPKPEAPDTLGADEKPVIEQYEPPEHILKDLINSTINPRTKIKFKAIEI